MSRRRETNRRTVAARSRSITLIAAGLTATAAPALAVNMATVNVNYGQVAHADAPLLIGTSFDARASFVNPAQPAVPIGYYDPQTAAALPIGQQWEDDWKQTAFRYPLGPVNVWDWKATVGPIANRPVISGVGQKSAFGVDEFMAMIARPNVNVAPADVTWLVNLYGPGGFNNANTAQAVQDAQDLVEYLNKPWDGSAFNGTNYEALRAENGHVAPYGVKTFALGNEPWATGEFNFQTAGDPNPANDGSLKYATLASQFITAMRAVDPTIEIAMAGPGPALTPAASAKVQLWNQNILTQLGGQIDVIVTNIFYDSEQADQFKRGVQGAGDYLTQVSQDIANFNAANGTNLRQIVGEYGHFLDLDLSTNPPTPLDNPDFLMQWQAAVATADFIAMISDTPGIERAHSFVWGNAAAQWHPIKLDIVNGSPQYTVLPVAQLFQLLGDAVLDNAVAVDVASAPASDGETYSVQAGAFLSDDGLLASLMLVNRDPAEGQMIDVLGLDGFSLTGALLLTATGPNASDIIMTPLTLPPDQTTFDLPALSVLLLQFRADDATASIPEPMSAGLFAIAGGALLVRPRRRLGRRLAHPPAPGRQDEGQAASRGVSAPKPAAAWATRNPGEGWPDGGVHR